MGLPKSLDPRQLRRLQRLTRDTPEIDRTVRIGTDGLLTLDLPMRSNDILLVEIERQPTSD